MHNVFTNRQEAGKQLAAKLYDIRPRDGLVLGIARGGIPVAAAVAEKLRLEWNVLVVRKLPIPWNPEAGFGAVTADGAVVLNEAMVSGLQMNKQQIEAVVSEVRSEMVRRAEVFGELMRETDPRGRTVLIIDDGLASGYTLLAAIKSVRARGAAEVIAAAPVASKVAATLIEKEADECVFEIVSQSVPFAVADYYLEWRDLTDEDVLQFLRKNGRRTEAT